MAKRKNNGRTNGAIVNASDTSTHNKSAKGAFKANEHRSIGHFPLFDPKKPNLEGEKIPPRKYKEVIGNRYKCQLKCFGEIQEAPS